MNLIQIHENTIQRQPWQPDSWQKFAVAQNTYYQNSAHLKNVLHELERSPEVVSYDEIIELQKNLLEVAAGKALILQAGDCAERFEDCDESSVYEKRLLLNSLAFQLHTLTGKKIIVIGRIAGQFFKPRSTALENFQGTEIPVFRGEGINSFGATLQSRTPDPDRLRLAYLASLRAKKKFCEVGELFKAASWFTSHEGLHLPYEEALVRLEPKGKHYYATSGHFLWIGDRTRASTGAHVEFFSGVANPVGIKLGPNHKISEILQVVDRLSAHDSQARVIIMTRFGAKNIASLLPPLLSALRSRRVFWLCDPMHGNTFQATSGLKTRAVTDVIYELKMAIKIHAEENTPLSGIHLEIATDEVMECVDENLSEKDLGTCYQTHCDPRLNPIQALKVLTNIPKF